MKGFIDERPLVGGDDDATLQRFRRVAFIAVALSTTTMLACVVAFPICYQYIQRLHSSLISDIDFCKVYLNLL